MSEINLPKFDEFLAPILKYANDDKEHTQSETIEAMSNQFNLSEEDRNLLMPNGTRTYIYNRMAWAITYLVQAGLLVRTGRSKYKISDLGKEEVKIIPEKGCGTQLFFTLFLNSSRILSYYNINSLPNVSSWNICLS